MNQPQEIADECDGKSIKACQRRLGGSKVGNIVLMRFLQYKTLMLAGHDDLEIH
jgi:hypothetical protein